MESKTYKISIGGSHRKTEYTDLEKAEACAMRYARHTAEEILVLDGEGKIAKAIDTLDGDILGLGAVDELGFESDETNLDDLLGGGFGGFDDEENFFV